LFGLYFECPLADGTNSDIQLQDFGTSDRQLAS
jgi:hypothetical protein